MSVVYVVTLNFADELQSIIGIYETENVALKVADAIDRNCCGRNSEHTEVEERKVRK